MSKSNQRNVHLKTLLEQLENIHSQLRNSITDFVQQVETKTMQWMDATSETDMTFKDVVAMVTAANTLLLEHLEITYDQSTLTLYPGNHATTSMEKSPSGVHGSTDISTETRLKRLEMALESTKQKTEDGLQELKQWRDNFVEEQDNNADELNTQIEGLKENNLNKPLDELCLDIEEIEIICHSISKEMQVHSDKTSSLKQEIKNHYDWISNLHEEAKKNTSITSKKIEDLFLKFETIDNVVWKLSNKVNTMETCLHRRYVCYMELDVTTPFNDGSICSTFRYARESNGQHFDQTTGKFVSPHDGLYLVCVDLHESENKPIRMDVFVAKQCRSRIGINIGYTRATACVVVDMCTDADLYFKLFSPVEDANLTPYSNITIVSL